MVYQFCPEVNLNATDVFKKDVTKVIVKIVEPNGIIKASAFLELMGTIYLTRITLLKGEPLESQTEVSNIQQTFLSLVFIADRHSTGFQLRYLFVNVSC